MKDNNQIKILAIGFAVFAAIYFFTFLLLVLVTAGVFVALGITMANDTGDVNQAGIGVLGAVFTVIFYGVLGLICVLPTALASWKLFKKKPRVRLWGIIAAIVVLPIFPLGTALGGFSLWFFFSPQGRNVQREVFEQRA
ncbi:MAG TPA: hypothetical protein VJU86_23070 [Pyrinomonadaceae bacterium]|nr:hypothetical protein [Pyrinomonadaceae bacterium]